MRKSELSTLLARLCDVVQRLERKLDDAPTDTPLLVPMDVAARRLSISRGSLERMVKRKEIDSRLIAGRRLIPAAELARLSG